MKKYCYLILSGLLVSLTSFCQQRGEKETYATIGNLNHRITLGMGMILDTPSNLSYQYALYSTLIENPVITVDNEKVVPVLTLRKGLCNYYIEGIYSKMVMELKVWKKNELLQTIRLTPASPQDEQPGRSDRTALLNKLASVLGASLQSQKSRSKGDERYRPLPYLTGNEVGGVESFIYSSAVNYIPEINFKTDLCKMYSVASLEASYNKQKAIVGSKLKSLDEYLAKSRPDLVKLFQTPRFYPKTCLEQAQMVARLYNITHSDNFFFVTDLISENQKNACVLSAFPLWKRPGTMLGYYQAGMNFLTAGYPDAALEAFYSSLVTADNIAAPAALIVYLKGKIYDGISLAQTNLGNAASVNYAFYMKEFSRDLLDAPVLDVRGYTFNLLSNAMGQYFQNIENNAFSARSQSRAALLNTPSGGSATSSSANDDRPSPYPNTTHLTALRQNSSSMSSDKMVAILNTTSAVIPATSNARNDEPGSLNSITPHLTALTQHNHAAREQNADYIVNPRIVRLQKALVFCNAYSLVPEKMEPANANSLTQRPHFARDFVRSLGDTSLSQEKKEVFMAYASHFPSVKDAVVAYYQAVPTADRNVLLMNVYRKLADIELTLAGKDNMGEKSNLAELSKN